MTTISNQESRLIVTASDDSHTKSQMQFLKSLHVYYPLIRVDIWDLGWNQENRHTIATLAEELFGGLARLRDFPYHDFPAWYDIKKDCGQYAWKPALLEITARHYQGPMLWMDAGCKITGSSLERVFQIIRDFGVYASTTRGTLVEYTDSRTLDFLQVPEILHGTQMRAATAVGLDLREEVPHNPSPRALLRAWDQAARARACIAPDGVTCKGRKGGMGEKLIAHRYDQSILTALLAQSGLTDKLPNDRPGWKAHCDCDRR